MPNVWRSLKGRPEKRMLKQSDLSRGVIEYSHVLAGLFCVPCVLSGRLDTGAARRSRGTSMCLVKEPLRNYGPLHGQDGYLTSHLSTKYHNEAMQDKMSFFQVQGAKQ